MAQVIMYQMSLFGSFGHVKPEPEIYAHLMKEMEGFLPSALNVNTLNPITGEIVTQQAIQMINNKNGFNVVIIPERIDVNYQFQTGKTAYTATEPLKKESEKIFQKVVASFEENAMKLSGTRLAVNCRVTFKSCTVDESKEYRKRFAPSINYYQDRDVPEWNVSLTGKGCVRLCDHDEETNEITNILCIPLPDKTVTLNAVFDVNTVPNNMVERFDSQSMSPFADYAEKTIAELQHALGGILA